MDSFHGSLLGFLQDNSVDFTRRSVRRVLTVCCPGMTFTTEFRLSRLSSFPEYQTKAVSS